MSAFIDIVVPTESQEGTTATLAKWLIQIGDPISQHAPLLELETDKVTQEVAAPASGILAEIVKQEGEEIEANAVLGRIAINGGVVRDETVAQEQPGSSISHPDAKVVSHQNSPLSPAVRRLIREHQLDIAQITGTGKDGRVSKPDVLHYMAQLKSSSSDTIAKQTKQTQTGPVASPVNQSEMVPYDAMRRRIAEHMVSSLLHTAPHVTSVFEADMSAVLTHRRANHSLYKEKGVHLTLTAYFVSATVKALAAVPEVNSRFHDDALEIFSDMNIGVGTALEDKGLIVPVIQQAQTKSLFDIATRLQDLTQKAKQGSLDPKDVQHGTFTISNHGVSGSLLATPIIINQPQSAILGIGKLEKRVVVRDMGDGEAIQVRPMLYVTLTIDHRVLDGYQTNHFLSTFVNAIQTWD